jgi:hypothetical protein
VREGQNSISRGRRLCSSSFWMDLGGRAVSSFLHSSSMSSNQKRLIPADWAFD